MKPKKYNKKILVKKKQIENYSPLEEIFFDYCVKNELDLIRQYSVGAYSLDFAYLDKRNIEPRFKIAIEIDGLKYHSYLEQRESDYQRQIVLLMNDWYVIRFTGRQIYKNKQSCFSQLINYIDHLQNKYDQKRIIIHGNN